MMAPNMTYERLSEAEEQSVSPSLTRTKRRRHWFCVAGLTCLGVWVAAAQGIRAMNRPYLEAQQKLRPAATNGSTSQLPVVLWHGMGDSCCADWSIGAVADHLRSTNPGRACSGDMLGHLTRSGTQAVVPTGVFVYSIATGSGMAADTFSGYFGDLNSQVSLELQTHHHCPDALRSSPLQRGLAAPCTHMSLPGGLSHALHL